MTNEQFDDERVLEDDYNVFPGYAYIADGVVIQSPVAGTVATLKRAIGAAEIRRCDIVGRMVAAGIPIP